MILTLLLVLYLWLLNDFNGHVQLASLSPGRDSCDKSDQNCIRDELLVRNISRLKPQYRNRPECAVPRLDKLPEIRQVVFAKVHKAASTTMQSILLRFAMTRNLSVLLPQRGPIISQGSAKIPRASVVPHPEGKTMFDVLCSHVLYDPREIANYFPDSAVRVAIIREPMEQALSALTYYGTKYPSPELKAALMKYPQDPINGYLIHPEDFVSRNSRRKLTHSYINNRMSVDLGIDLQDFETSKRNKSKTETFLRNLEEEFDLVLISNYFEESMILLRRYMHWPIKDVIYLKVNTAQQTETDTPWNQAPILNATTKLSFRKWNIYDYELYEYFLPIFRKRINAECFFEEEVNAFKIILNKVKEYCSNTNGQASLQVPKGDWNDIFEVSKADCELMSMSEPDLVEKARIKQLKLMKTFSLDPRRTHLKS